MNLTCLEAVTLHQKVDPTDVLVEGGGTTARVSRLPAIAAAYPVGSNSVLSLDGGPSTLRLRKGSPHNGGANILLFRRDIRPSVRSTIKRLACTPNTDGATRSSRRRQAPGVIWTQDMDSMGRWICCGYHTTSPDDSEIQSARATSRASEPVAAIVSLAFDASRNGRAKRA